MDGREPAGVRALRPALAERSDECEIGAGQAADPAGQARRAQTHGGRARGGERHFLRPVHRLPVARLAQGFAAQEHGARVSSTLGRRSVSPPPCALRASPRVGWQGSRPQCCDHRQPECQGRRKGGSGIDPSGYDAGKCPPGDAQRQSQGQEPHRRRHTWPHAGCPGSSGQHSRSRWRPAVAQRSTPAVSVYRAPLCRWRLPGTCHRGRRPDARGLGGWRSSSAPIRPRASSCSPRDGSSSDRLLGSSVAAGWPRFLGPSPEPRSPSCGWRSSASCYDESQEPHIKQDLRGRTLSLNLSFCGSPRHDAARDNRGFYAVVARPCQRPRQSRSPLSSN